MQLRHGTCETVDVERMVVETSDVVAVVTVDIVVVLMTNSVVTAVTDVVEVACVETVAVIELVVVEVAVVVAAAHGAAFVTQEQNVLTAEAANFFNASGVGQGVALAGSRRPMGAYRPAGLGRWMRVWYCKPSRAGSISGVSRLSCNSVSRCFLY